MANKASKKLYAKLRTQGVRKKTARLASETAGQLNGKGRVPKALRSAIGDLRGALDQLERRVEAHDRSAAGRKAARTRQTKTQRRSDAARKAARKRAKETM